MSTWATATRTGSWRLDQVEAVRFVRELNMYPSLPGEEPLTVRFDPATSPALFCYLEDGGSFELSACRLGSNSAPGAATAVLRRPSTGRFGPTRCLPGPPPPEGVTEMTARTSAEALGTLLLEQQ